MADIIQQSKLDYTTHDEKRSSSGDHSPAMAPERQEMIGFVSVDSELPKGYYRSSYFLGTYLATTLSQTSAAGTYIMTAAVSGAINADIGPSENLNWIFTVYILSTAVGLLLFGRLSDIFGRRWFFVGASLLGLVGSIVAATAKNVNTVIGGEVLIGLGATAGLSYTTVLGELVPMKHRFLAIGVLYIGNIPVGGFGAAIATAFESHTATHWRGLFWLMVATNGAAALCWFLFYHPPNFEMKNVNATRIALIKNFDYLGTFLFITGFILFLLGLSWGGVVYPWKSAKVIATMVVGVLLIIGLAFYEIFVPLKEPLIPVHLFKNGGWVASNLLLGFGASVYYATGLVWPQMVAAVYAQSHYPMWAGWISSLVGVSIAMGELTGGMLAEKIGYVKYQCLFFITAGSACLAAMASCTIDSENKAIALVVVSLFCIGWNECVAFSLTTICIHDQREIGAAAGVAGSTRSIISTIASTIYQVVLADRLKKTIPDEVVPALTNAGLPASSIMDYFNAVTVGTSAALENVKGITPAIIAAGTRAYRIAYVEAFKTVFLTAIAFGVISIFLACCVPNVEDLMTHDVAATLHSRSDQTKLAGQSPHEKKIEEA